MVLTRTEPDAEDTLLAEEAQQIVSFSLAKNSQQVFSKKKSARTVRMNGWSSAAS
jgi:hypothetical protein